MNKTTKKILIFSVVTSLSFSFFGCNKTDDILSEDTTTATLSAVTETSSEQALAIDNSDLQELPKIELEKYIADDFAPEIDFPYDKEKCNISEDIFNSNLRLINSCTNYGSEITIEYIETADDFASKHKVLSDIKTLSDEICTGLTSDEEKAFALSLWVSRNIFYDKDAAHNDVSLEITNLKNTIETKKTTCAGYANLFTALCNAQGIFSINIRGGAPEVAGDTLESVPTNHEWNAVYINDQWIFYDTTWASDNYYLDGEFVSSRNLEYNYLGMDFYYTSLYRRVDRVDFRNFYTAFNEIY